MASFYRSTVRDFLNSSEEQVRAQLATGYAERGYTTQYTAQTRTWDRDLKALRKVLQKCVTDHVEAESWGVLLEFSIPRKERRVDVVLLLRDTVVLLEEKRTAVDATAERQVEEYALLLHYFHKGTRDRRIVPILVSPNPRLRLPLYIQSHQISGRALSAREWIAEVRDCSWAELAEVLLETQQKTDEQIAVGEWDTSPYFPVPSIIDAAISLRSGLSIREIAHSEASEHEIEAVTQTVQQCLHRAHSRHEHVICFLTGVPGSGKTLVGLSLAHSPENRDSAIHFMSGNGPLVKVLQHLFKQQAMNEGRNATDARVEAETLIENVHVFARTYTQDDPAAPSNHSIIFDEAQRAWNRDQNWKKFQRDYSEPEMLLKIMERHQDWAVVIALVGGGQEINDGEAGLEEWGNALREADRQWVIYASPEVLTGGPSTAGHRLFPLGTESLAIETTDTLHLRTSNRSLRAENLALWVNLVLEGDSRAAAGLRICDRFPIYLTRSLATARNKLRGEHLGEARYGLVGSSGAARLRAVGLEPNASFHADYPWHHWYLAEDADVRSSYRCEVFATEFEIQGLELDWTGVCWGGDFVWDPQGSWRLRTLAHGSVTRWREIANPEKRTYRANAYRVLLTRARQGMVIYVPSGNVEDLTDSPVDFDHTARFLEECGVRPIDR